VLKASGTFGWDVLAALIDVRFNHDSSDGGFTGDELGSDVGADFRLIAMVFGGVAICRVAQKWKSDQCGYKGMR